jgi:hypothetical protein
MVIIIPYVLYKEPNEKYLSNLDYGQTISNFYFRFDFNENLPKRKLRVL